MKPTKLYEIADSKAREIATQQKEHWETIQKINALQVTIKAHESTAYKQACAEKDSDGKSTHKNEKNREIRQEELLKDNDDRCSCLERYYSLLETKKLKEIDTELNQALLKNVQLEMRRQSKSPVVIVQPDE